MIDSEGRWKTEDMNHMDSPRFAQTEYTDTEQRAVQLDSTLLLAQENCKQVT